MNHYQITKNVVLAALAMLIATCIIADMKSGQKIEDKVTLALISALITVYTFAS